MKVVSDGSPRNPSFAKMRNLPSKEFSRNQNGVGPAPAPPHGFRIYVRSAGPYRRVSLRGSRPYGPAMMPTSWPKLSAKAVTSGQSQINAPSLPSAACQQPWLAELQPFVKAHDCALSLQAGKCSVKRFVGEADVLRQMLKRPLASPNT